MAGITDHPDIDLSCYLGFPRASVAEITDHPDMTLAVDCGHKVQ